jgi:hypothetical protein
VKSLAGRRGRQLDGGRPSSELKSACTFFAQATHFWVAKTKARTKTNEMMLDMLSALPFHFTMQ